MKHPSAKALKEPIATWPFGKTQRCVEVGVTPVMQFGCWKRNRNLDAFCFAPSSSLDGGMFLIINPP